MTDDKTINVKYSTLVFKIHRRFDIIIDCSGNDNSSVLMSHLKPWSNSKYITLTGPLLRNIGKQGIGFGTLNSLQEVMSKNVRSRSKMGNSYHWGFFSNYPGALEEMYNLVEDGMVTIAFCYHSSVMCL